MDLRPFFFNIVMRGFAGMLPTSIQFISDKNVYWIKEASLTSSENKILQPIKMSVYSNQFVHIFNSQQLHKQNSEKYIKNQLFVY